MSDLGLQATAIQIIITGLANYGVAYSYQPAPRGNAYSTFIEKFVVTISGKVQIRAWTVAYNGETREDRTVAIGATKVLRRINWLVRFFQSWDDTSEADFRDLIELAVNAIDSNRSLGGTALDHTSCSVTLPNQGQGVMLGDYGCHLGEIRFSALVEETLTSS